MAFLFWKGSFFYIGNLDIHLRDFGGEGGKDFGEKASLVMSRICLLCISKETTSYTNPFELKLGKVFTHPMEVPNIQK